MLDPGFLKRAMPVAALATELALLAGGGVVLGNWLDGKLGTGPWLTVLLLLGGFIGGTLNLFHGLARIQGNDDEPPANPP
jgi:F0F1-type ATP synthase assembly protein I